MEGRTQTEILLVPSATQNDELTIPLLFTLKLTRSSSQFRKLTFAILSLRSLRLCGDGDECF